MMRIAIAELPFSALKWGAAKLSGNCSTPLPSVAVYLIRYASGLGNATRMHAKAGRNLAH